MRSSAEASDRASCSDQLFRNKNSNSLQWGRHLRWLLDEGRAIKCRQPAHQRSWMARGNRSCHDPPHPPHRL